jgi:hypothetical protein
MEDFKNSIAVDEKPTNASASTESIVAEASEIYIDPVKEKAVLRKFDKFFLPQAFAFLVLNYLDRSNVSTRNPFKKKTTA